MDDKRLGIVPPVPTVHETLEQYHEEHRRVGRWLDGRCLVCFPPTAYTALTEPFTEENDPWLIGKWPDLLRKTYHCGLTFQIGHGEYAETDSCGEPAIACDLGNGEEGRCKDHLEEFRYLEGWGWLPKPKFVLEILDGPLGFKNG